MQSASSSYIIFANVASNHAAVKLYKKNGFRIDGTEPRSLKVGDCFHDEHMMILEF